MGDLPIFIAYDSSDLWANKDLFTVIYLGFTLIDLYSILFMIFTLFLNRIGNFTMSICISVIKKLN